MKTTSMRETQLEGFRTHIIKQLTGLLETHIRMRSFDQNLTACMSDELKNLASSMMSLQEESSVELLKANAKECQNLTIKQQLLADKTAKTWEENSRYIKALVLDFQNLIERLGAAMIDVSLFERQSKVLEKIILSHEVITNWKDFVQQVLLEFYAVFPFKFFTIAFSEKEGVNLYIYYLDSYSDECKQKIRQKLIDSMKGLMQGQEPDSSVDIGDLEALAGVRKFPVRIKCAALSWNVVEQALGLKGSAEG